MILMPVPMSALVAKAATPRTRCRKGGVHVVGDFHGPLGLNDLDLCNFRAVFDQSVVVSPEGSKIDR